jgi:hypothetical protein
MIIAANTVCCRLRHQDTRCTHARCCHNTTKLRFFFLQTIIAVVPFSEVLPPKLKQFYQIHFAAVEEVCMLTISTGDSSCFLDFFFWWGEVHLRAINKTNF